MSNKIFIFGYGYTASFFCRQLVHKGWKVTGTIRKKENSDNLIAEGVKPVLLSDLNAIQDEVSNSNAVLITVPPDDFGDPVIKTFSDVFARSSKRISWLAYLSSTSVYGDHMGRWVSETTKLRTSSQRGKNRVLAEMQWKELSKRYKFPVKIFRISGIYGPDRNPFARIKSGTMKIIKKKDHFFNRIHIADIVGILDSSLRNSAASGIYNLADDMPSSQAEFVKESAKLLGMETPPEVEIERAELSEQAKSFYYDSKKIINRKVKKDLNYEFRYPDYKAGLRSLIESG